MKGFVKVASVAMNIPEYRDKPEGQSLSDYMIEMIKVEIDRVLPDKPDLIVLPEMADTPAGMPLEEKREFWKARGNRTEEDLGKIAKENKDSDWNALAQSAVYQDDSAVSDAISALMVLGYTKAEAQGALKGVSPTATLEEMVSAALRKMALRF